MQATHWLRHFIQQHTNPPDHVQHALPSGCADGHEILRLHFLFQEDLPHIICVVRGVWEVHLVVGHHLEAHY